MLILLPDPDRSRIRNFERFRHFDKANCNSNTPLGNYQMISECLPNNFKVEEINLQGTRYSILGFCLPCAEKKLQENCNFLQKETQAKSKDNNAIYITLKNKHRNSRHLNIRNSAFEQITLEELFFQKTLRKDKISTFINYSPVYFFFELMAFHLLPKTLAGNVQ